MNDLAKALIRSHESLRLKPYHDSVGKLTIGYGRNLDDVGISQIEAEYLLEIDVQRAVKEAMRFVGEGTWGDLTEGRRAVLIDMAYNLGDKLEQFERFKKALQIGEYEVAASDMLDSLWARQVEERATELAMLMRESNVV